MPKTKDHTLLLFLPLFLGVLFASRFIIANPLSSDSWIHLGVGRYILEQKHIPTHSNVSFKDVDNGYKFLAHSWLSDVLFYLSFGKPGWHIFIFTLPSLILSLFLLHLLLKKLKISAVVQSIVLTIAVLIAPVYWRLHPFLNAVPLLLIMYLVYLGYKEGNRRILFWLPLLMMAFANLAGGYIFIPAVLLLILLGAEIIFLIFKKTKRGAFLQFLISCVASLTMSLLNPWGVSIYTYAKTVFDVLLNSKYMSSLVGALLISNTNYAKDVPDSTFYSMYLGYILFSGLLCMFLLIRIRGEFLARFAKTFPLLIFFSLGYLWIKFIPLSVFLTAPLFAICIEESLHLLKKSRIMYNSSSFIVLIFLGLGSLYLLLHPPYTPSIKTPFAQIKVIKDVNLDGNVFPVVELAGFTYYNFYPMRGFLDAQDDLFDENEVLNVYSTIQSLPAYSFEHIADTYNISMVISTQNTDFLNVALQKNPDWILSYLDTDGIVFLKTSLLSDDYVTQHDLSYIDFSRNLGFDPGHIDSAIAELERFTAKYPNAQLALGELASMYRIKQDFTKAEKTLDRIPKDQWNYIVLTEMGRINAAEGNCSEAEMNFQAALQKRSERLLSRTILDLAVLYATCFNDTATATHYFKRYNSFRLPVGEREKARQLAKQFGIPLDDIDTNTENTQK
ncbi:MAG: tetratricopeptide repeat protein [Candidatus Levyibacteriota bacterium]